MRWCLIPLVLVLVLALSGVGSVHAETWRNQFLANTSGSHLIQVPRSERHATEAFFEVQGFRLRIGCTRRSLNGHKNATVNYMVVGTGSPDYGTAIDLAATFDGSQNVELGRFGYSGGDYGAPLRTAVLARIIESKTFALSSLHVGLHVEVPMEGAPAAINEIECLGDT